MSRFWRRTGKTVAVLLPVAALVALVVSRPWHVPPPGHPRAHSPAAAHGTLSGTLPARGFILGVREAGIPGPWAPVARFASLAGSAPRLVLFYSDWRERFRYGFAKSAATHHAAVLVQMQPWSTPLTQIAAGRYDGYLRSYAREVRIFRRPVVIGFGHEMNGNWYPWGHGHQAAAAFVAAWRHIVTVFRSQGARNVRWLWTVSSSVPPGRSLRAYWPGKRYVTWVGIDGYYEQRGSRFGQVFGRMIRQLRTFTAAPILLSEAAIGQVAGQARMMANLYAGIRRYHLLGLVWFDVAQQGGPAHQNWRLEGHPAAAAAFHHDIALLLHH